MELTKNEILKIAKKYGTTIFDDDDIVNAFDFVEAVFRAEAEKTKETVPYATKTIEKYEMVAHEVAMMLLGIDLEPVFDNME